MLKNLRRFRGELFKFKMIEIFSKVMLLKNYYLNLKFFQVLQSILINMENKYSQKRRILPKDWPIHQETAEKH